MGDYWSRFRDPAELATCSVLGTIHGYWGSNFLYYLIIRNNWLREYKIQDKMPSNKLIRKELIENFVGLFTTIPLFAFIFYYVFRLETKKKETEEKNTPTTTGWANLRLHGPQPRLMQHLTQIGIAYLLYDFAFYWTHRLLHNPSLFLKVHRIHHRFKTPVGISASYSHMFESLNQLLIWWFPIGLAGFLCGDLHISTIYWYTVFRWVETVEAHSGYDIPFHPLKLLWLPAGARFHDYHHSHFDGNYGASKIWDWLLGTDKDYHDYLKSKLK